MSELLVLLQTSGIPQAEPLPLPAPVWLLWGLLLFTFLLHIVPMNFLIGGSLMAVISRIRAGKGSESDRKLYDWLRKTLPVTVAAAVTFGVAPLLFVQTLYGRLLYSSSILIGWYWLAVIPLVILAYYGTYLLAFKGSSLDKRSMVVSGVTVVLFLVIAFIYTNNMTLMLRPGVFVEKYLQDGRGLHLNLDEPMLLPRYLHNVFSAIAVTGMIVALYGLFKRKTDPEFGRWAVRKGARWFGHVTILNMAFGVWFLFALPKEVIIGIMGPVGVVGLMLGIVAGLVAVFLAMQAGSSERPGSKILGATAALVVSLVSMIVLRDQVRQIYLKAADYQLVRWIEADWLTIGIFVLLLLLAVGTVVWMVVQLSRASAVVVTKSD